MGFFNKLKKKVSNVGKGITSAAHDVGNFVNNAVDTGKQYADTAKEKLSHTIDNAGDMLHRVESRAGEIAGKARDSIGKASDMIQHDVLEPAQQKFNDARDFVHETGDKINQTVERGKQWAHDQTSKIEEGLDKAGTWGEVGGVAGSAALMATGHPAAASALFGATEFGKGAIDKAKEYAGRIHEAVD